MTIFRNGMIIQLLIFFIALQSDASETELKRATLIPQWVPQAQFAGYYMALEKGIYKKYGIDLTIIPGGPDNPSLDLLKSGQADFATLWLTTGIQARSEGVRVIHLCQTMQESAMILVAKRSSGIQKPRDMNGKKVGLWGPCFQIQPKAFFKKFNLDVKIIRQSYSINLFLRDGVDVVSAMWYNEYHTILNSGLNEDELTTFFFHEYGLNFPEDGIYCLDATYRRDPELCHSFVQASWEGWIYAFEHPEETVDLVMKNLREEHIPATRVHQRWMLERMKDMMFSAGRISMGVLSLEDYDRVATALHENGLIGNIPDISDFSVDCRIDDEK